MALTTDTVGAAVQETADGTLVGRNSDSKVGFYGAVPVVRPVIPATPAAQDIADVLVALGVATQAA